MPNFPLPHGYKPIDYLKEITLNGLKKILDISRFAPSGGNTQPWKIYVLNQDLMKKLETLVLTNLDNGVSETPNFNIYPQPMSDHLKNRVKACGRLCLLYTSPSPRDRQKSRMPSSA